MSTVHYSTTGRVWMMDMFITDIRLNVKCASALIVSSDASITVGSDASLLIDTDVWGRSDTTVTYRLSCDMGASYTDLPL